MKMNHIRAPASASADDVQCHRQECRDDRNVAVGAYDAMAAVVVFGFPHWSIPLQAAAAKLSVEYHPAR
jgi:hypothetical protein